MERIRTFIAIDIEEPRVLREISKLQEELRSVGSSLKLVELRNIHLTLRFLGEVDLSTVEEVKELMKGLEFKPFEMELKGVGGFPSLERPKVIWIGVSKGAEEVKRLHELLEGGLKTIGFRPDPKGFEPHITVARVKRYSSELIERIRDNSDRIFGKVLVNEVRLKKSTLTPRGPIYDTLFGKRAL